MTICYNKLWKLLRACDDNIGVLRRNELKCELVKALLNLI